MACSYGYWEGTKLVQCWVDSPTASIEAGLPDKTNGYFANWFAYQKYILAANNAAVMNVSNMVSDFSQQSRGSVTTGNQIDSLMGGYGGGDIYATNGGGWWGN